MKPRDDRNEPGALAKITMLASALLVAALLAYMAFHAVTAPAGGEPKAEVVSTTPMEEGDVRVEVAVTNQAERGLREVTLEVDCDDPAPEIALANVPAQGQRRGIVICPPGTIDPTASVSSYTRT